MDSHSSTFLVLNKLLNKLHALSTAHFWAMLLFLLCVITLSLATSCFYALCSYAQSPRSAKKSAAPGNEIKQGTGLQRLATTSTITVRPTLRSTSGTVQFSGYRWNIKHAATRLGPGNNYYTTSASQVFVDADGMLHLRVLKPDSVWRCVEIISDSVGFGYGEYVFYLANRIDNIDRNVIAHLMISDDSSRTHDATPLLTVRFARWGQKSNVNALEYDVRPPAQPVLSADGQTVEHQEQPAAERVVHYPQSPFYMNGDYSTHVIRWEPGRIRFASYHDHANPGPFVADKWSFPERGTAAESIPKPSATTCVRLGLWIFIPPALPVPHAPASNTPAGLVIKKFTYTPLHALDKPDSKKPDNKQDNKQDNKGTPQAQGQQIRQ